MYVNRKAENAAHTRAALERVARARFEADGFQAVSAEEIVAAAGVTRGALYHHYDGKEGLFEAVAEAAMQRLHRQVGAAARTAKDPMAALRLGVQRFLVLATAPRLQRVLFIDAPAVLGWQRWRELDARYGLGMLQQAIEQAMTHGQMRRSSARSAQFLAHVVLSALIEAAMLIARATDKPLARRESEDILLRLLDGLA